MSQATMIMRPPPPNEGWQEGAPPKRGVYERWLSYNGPHFAKWTGLVWLRAARTPEEAARQIEPSAFKGASTAWRPVA